MDEPVTAKEFGEWVTNGDLTEDGVIASFVRRQDPNETKTMKEWADLVALAVMRRQVESMP